MPEKSSDVIRVLMIEDNPGDIRLLREMLKSSESRFRVESADRLSAGLKRLADGGIDVVLLDLGLPDSVGLETLAKARQQAGDIPIIVLTGLEERDTAVEALRRGARDFLAKNRVDTHLLTRAILRQIKK
jgi:DNA-binding response OmpR family regulator